MGWVSLHRFVKEMYSFLIGKLRTATMTVMFKTTDLTIYLCCYKMLNKSLKKIINVHFLQNLNYLDWLYK